MKVTKAQAQANRERIVETASRLFRERGYDGVGIADLMAAAGFTHGGFYKHFESKAQLMEEAAECGIRQTAAQTEDLDAADFFQRYVSRAHRDARGTGCTMAALGGDATRQPEAVRAAFAAGIEKLREALVHGNALLSDADPDQARARALDMLAHAVGAIVMSRACPDDSPLAEEILDVCRTSILEPLEPSPAARRPGS
ncbi:MAG TPA: TetR family transcriptional regulator [Castellaniella sp.]|nr:TetR family transcriptional regulator [Castellaniella sp.]